METQPSGYTRRMSFSHQTGERGNAVGKAKPERLALLVGNGGGGGSPRSVKVWDGDVRSRKKKDRVAG